MRSSRAKVLHEIGGLAMLGHVLATAQALGCARRALIVGHQAEAVADAARRLDPDIITALQDPPRGTAHAAIQARVALDAFGGDVFILFGDVPLIRPLLKARRRDVMAHLRRHGVPWAMDPTNEDRRFMRVRVRREVLPLLEELSPKVVDHFCDLADEAGERPTTAREGDPLAALTKAQRQALARAIEQRRGGATVRVSGGQDLEVAFLKGTPVVFVRQ